ncbi:uncharacterized protein BO97DRAFT_49051 [Aspergillus homomorphus CBS 101889]|uniref:Uncharacterized protein n=1 Tax=Aspergillus homomorphus (strain CBS 101889) TaxID=1450537 RepID=A0A395HYD7_ASPHC|nr:hypothetical protein BO97DRAFT_49051 [Aspergillus homomorphus CBS 101889]RAL12941.1 hypothetical protein BO97DRAFT_49051 [Aspergillus homomorphus CBS 101889]
MSSVENVSQPSLLQEFCVREDLSRLSIEPKPVSHLRQATISLLHPLEKANKLELCRPKMDLSTISESPRRNCDRYKHEYLDLQPLGKIWRQELIKIPPFSRLIFDLTLPPSCLGVNGRTSRFLLGYICS